MSLGGPEPRHGGRRVRRRRPAAARRGRRAGVHQAVAGHDPRASTKTPSATSRPTGRGGPTCGCTATGRRSQTIDGHDEWFLHGRSDDTIKVAGKRLGPAEVESALVSHPAVVEAAAVGAARRAQGRAALGATSCWPPAPSPTSELRGRARRPSWPTQLGKSFRPAGVRFVRALPKTRSAKVVRRAVRAVATGADPGDLSSLEDPAALDAHP